MCACVINNVDGCSVNAGKRLENLCGYASVLIRVYRKKHVRLLKKTCATTEENMYDCWEKHVRVLRKTCASAEEFFNLWCKINNLNDKFNNLWSEI